VEGLWQLKIIANWFTYDLTVFKVHYGKMEAGIKVFDTPTHVYVTMDLNGKPETGESIYVGGLIYAKYNGKWSSGTPN
jgi:hypothetical protein